MPETNADELFRPRFPRPECLMMRFTAGRRPPPASLAHSLTYGVGGCRWNEASIGAQVAAGGEQFLFVMRLIAVTAIVVSLVSPRALPAPTSVQSLVSGGDGRSLRPRP